MNTRIFNAIWVAPLVALALAVAPQPSPSGLRAACPPVRRGVLRCLTLYRPQTAVNAAIAAGTGGPAARPAGWGARALEAAYRLPVQRDSRQTVAVSVAYHTPKLAQYLAVYRKEYGLPRCTLASGCLRQVGQNGSRAHLPASGVGSGWDLEATLDVSMISAACPRCRILVVEANSPALGDLARSEATAARLGASVISNSYGTREYGYAQKFARWYGQPGHTIVVSAGDAGYTAANFPANLSTVTAAGGTSLARARNARGWTESVWNDPETGAGGSGCSAYVARPAWQPPGDCPMRAVADVSAVATNIPVYNRDWGGWVSVAGTSASAPLIAGIYGLAGNAARIPLGYAYRHASQLYDVTAGNNDWFNQAGGASCGGDYLCVAGPGYDAPTGLGTPHGTGAF
jgi:subtilase family serine protease